MIHQCFPSALRVTGRTNTLVSPYLQLRCCIVSKNLPNIFWVAFLSGLLFCKQPVQLLQGDLPFHQSPIRVWLEIWSRLPIRDLLALWDVPGGPARAYIQPEQAGLEVRWVAAWSVEYSWPNYACTFSLGKKMNSCSPPSYALPGRCFPVVPLPAPACSSSGGLKRVSPAVERSGLILLDPGSRREPAVCFPNLFVEQ